MLQVNGEGKEPALELETNLLEFGPILPHGQGDEKTVVLRNPGVFPIEVYNVEFDTQFIDEERVRFSFFLAISFLKIKLTVKRFL